MQSWMISPRLNAGGDCSSEPDSSRRIWTAPAWTNASARCCSRQFDIASGAALRVGCGRRPARASPSSLVAASIASLPRWPWTQRARRLRSSRSGVRGPVLRPPCIRATLPAFDGRRLTLRMPIELRAGGYTRSRRSPTCGSRRRRTKFREGISRRIDSRATCGTAIWVGGPGGIDRRHLRRGYHAEGLGECAARA